MSHSKNLLCISLVLALTVPATFAIEPPQTPPTLGDQEHFSVPRYQVQVSADRFEPGSPTAAGRADLARFFAAHGPEWTVDVNRRNDRVSLLQGRGVPAFAGRGNDLSNAAPTDVVGAAAHARAFMAQYPELYGSVSPDELVLDAATSTGYKGYYWNVELQQTVDGVPIQGAKIFFRYNHGNLVQTGSSHTGDLRGFNATPNVDRADVARRIAAELGISLGELTFSDAGNLMIYPTALPGEQPGHAYDGAHGRGYQYELVWEATFRRDGDPTTYQAVLDARSGKLNRLVDLNRYAQVTGGILPTTTSDPEVMVGMPYTTVSNSGTKVTDADGNYSYSGGSASLSLNGRYTAINDNCGPILLSSSDGNLDLGTSGGTDCVTPGVGGAGNTKSARSGFYHLTNINRKAASFDPGNGWLDGTLTANMNINSDCNAFWDGSTVNFYTSGGGCGNTGEIAAVFLHEWGHGYDSNSGGPASENGSGEALGDTFAFLETRDSCIGPGFRLGTPCYNCDTCDGVRDVHDFGINGNATIASPANVESNTGIDCDRWACPYFQFIFIGPYQGPMGYEGHCEAIIAASANWDLSQMLVAEYGTAGWDAMDAIWYGSIHPAQSAYQVASGGQCNPGAVVDGCGANNWYTVYLSVDDDDGNLSNGTPNGCRIWDAFNAHGIACGARPTCTGGGGGGCTVDADCDNGLWCDGAEVCNAGTCEAGTAPSCDDGVSCTVDTCNEGADACDNTPDDGACDNGAFCDGAETCNATLDCQAGTPPSCAFGCDEAGDACFECSVDADCDDGAFCNGAETCNAGSCQAGSDPCPGATCDEAGDVCVSCAAAGASCSAGSECCSGSCKGKAGAKTCK